MEGKSELKKHGKIKVCYSTHETNLTGASQSLLDMLDNLDREKIEPIVLLRKEGPLEDELRARGVNYEVIYYTQSIKESKKNNIARNYIKRCVNVYQEQKIARFLKNEQIDILHNNSIFAISGMRAAKKARIPYICHIREVLFDDHVLRPISINNLKKCFSGSSIIIPISRYVYKKYEEIINNDKYEIINDGININKYYDVHKPLFEERVKILLAGRIEKAKGQIDAIKAVEELNKKGFTNLKLLIVGDDAPKTNYPDEIRKYVKTNNIGNVSFMGFQDLKKLRGECDICLVCSTNEALGRITIEGMLAGCLVIGADACATPEIINDGVTGLIYKPGDSLSLANCIEKAVLEKEKSREIAKKGQEFALSFDCKKYMERIEHLYYSFLNRNSSHV